MNNISNSILLLDDDNVLRGYLATLLNARGLNVVEAGNAREANNILQYGRPAMAIVDFRLPGQDGFSWIASVREQGLNFPVVVLSGTWCDEKTFSRLRNILKVSLILRKPVAGDLFIQQIESLLPAHLFMPANVYVEASPADSEGQEAEEDIAIAAAGSEQFEEEHSDQQVAPHDLTTEAPATAGNAFPSDTTTRTVNEHTDPMATATTLSAVSVGSLEPLTESQLKSKASKKKKLEAAKAAYGAQLSSHWSDLVKALTLAREDKTNSVVAADAMSIAHRLRGTAGSIGFPQISDAAGKIEDMLHHLDPTDTLQEVIWTEIFRWLAEGELAVRAASKEFAEAGEPKQDPLYKKVLLWGQESKYQNFGERRDMQIDVVETLPQILEFLSLDKYSAVFIDLSVADQGETFMGAKEIRAMHSGALACIPLGCVMPAFDVLPEELVYAGFSVVLQHGANEQEIEWACKRLTTVESGLNPNVLTVDDDEVLTSFIAAVLGGEGMSVHTLNKPVLILEALEKFKPEILLLDVMMPGLSGYDVCRMLRADEKWKHLSIIFLTSKSDQEGRAAAFQAGGNDFLSKPVLAEELLERVRAQHERKHSVRQTAESGLDGTMSGADFMHQATILLGEAAAETLPVSFCLLSIDDFGENSINHGMQAAKESLKILAQLTSNHFRADVLRGRIGEEGIALAFLGETQATVSMALQMMLLDFQEVSIDSEHAQYPFKCTFSAGVSQFPDNGTTVHKLLSSANQKLMTGRREGRGMIRYSSMDAALSSNG